MNSLARLLHAFALAAAASAPALPASAQTLAPRHFALVIGNNTTLDAKSVPLQFADDDAARMTELLADSGTDVELLTTLDQESQATFSALVGRARSPTRENVLAAATALAQRIEAAKHTGAETELIVYYSGHGNVGPDGDEYLNLAGGKLTRDDLFNELLGKSPADFNHLIVDACRSEAFVLSRGDWKPDRGDGEYTRALQHYLEERRLSNFPNTGVILASSVDQQTHEWSRYRGGVFTHQLVSGLSGGADLNGDGAFEYSELGAFIAAANSGVRDPRARLRVVVLPPTADERHAVLRLPDVSHQRVLLFAPEDGRRYTVEDARGVRLADVRHGGGQPAYLRLPPGDVYVYREAAPGADDSPTGAGDEETHVPATDTGLIALADLPFAESQRRTRGALDEAFRTGLFRVGYTPGYYAGYTDRTQMLAVEHPEWEIKIWHDGRPAEVRQMPAREGDEEDKDDDRDDDEGEHGHHHTFWGTHWGALSFGTLVGLDGTHDTTLSGATGRLSSADTNAWVGGARGFELAWHTFDLSQTDDYPGSDAFFRTGYLRGATDLRVMKSTDGTESPNRLTFQSVPLFFGFNGYLFEDFPLRPYAGAAVGIDVLHLDYGFAENNGRRYRTDLSARFGFELHAGVELRLTNYLAVQGEFRQLWSDTRELNGVPDFTEDGLSATVNLAFALPFERTASRAHDDWPVRMKIDHDPAAPADVPPAPAAPPAVPSAPAAPTAPVEPPAPTAPLPV